MSEFLNSFRRRSVNRARQTGFARCLGRARNLALAAAVCLVPPTGAVASTVTVVSESLVSASVRNLPFYRGFAGSGDIVTNFQRTSQGSSVVTALRDNGATIVSLNPTALAQSNLLVVAPLFSNGFIGRPDQLTLIRNFMSDGGNLLFLAESANATTSGIYNDFLASIGSSIRYATNFSRGEVRDNSLAATDVSSPSQMLEAFPRGTTTFFGLSGGETVADTRALTFNGRGFVNSVETFVAFEDLSPPAPIPLPAALPLLLVGLMALGFFRRWRV